MICIGSIVILRSDDKSGHVGYEGNYETKEGERSKNAAEKDGQAPR